MCNTPNSNFNFESFLNYLQSLFDIGVFDNLYLPLNSPYTARRVVAPKII